MDIISIFNNAVIFLDLETALNLRLVCKNCTFVDTYNYLRFHFFIDKEIDMIVKCPTFIYDVMKRWGYKMSCNNYQLILQFSKLTHPREKELFNKMKVFSLGGPRHYLDPQTNEYISYDISCVKHVQALLVRGIDIDTRELYLPNLVRLTVFGCGMEYSFLKYCTELCELSLPFATINDLTPLAKCTQLFELNLSHTEITDITPLAKCTNLCDLNLSYTEITDITPLAKCTQLSELNLSHTEITDITSLSKCKELHTLKLNITKITDITPLRNCINLHELYLSYTKITDITPLDKCKHLSLLEITGTKISKLPHNLNIIK
jgi:Leucine-rich repeat (LRR) protein